MLLIKAGLRLSKALLPSIFNPETTAIGSQHLIRKHNILSISSIFKLSIGKNDTSFLCSLRCNAVYFKAVVVDLSSDLFAYSSIGLFIRDVLVFLSKLSLRVWSPR